MIGAACVYLLHTYVYANALSLREVTRQKAEVLGIIDAGCLQ